MENFFKVFLSYWLWINIIFCEFVCGFGNGVGFVEKLMVVVVGF